MDEYTITPAGGFYELTNEDYTHFTRHASLAEAERERMIQAELDDKEERRLGEAVGNAI